MAAPSSHNHNAVPQDTLITIKISVNDSLKKLKLPLRDMGANVLIDKVCTPLDANDMTCRGRRNTRRG
jgi:next to BRCA1 gene 1 protein